MSETEYRPVNNTNPMNVFMVALLVGAALIIGVLYSEVRNLRQQVSPTVATNTNTVTQPTTNTGNPTTNTAPQEQFPSVSRSSIDPVTAQDHIQGSLSAPVTLIEYSDLDCPYCVQFHPTMEKIKAEYGDKIAWVYRHMPLAQLHPAAPKEAEAAECATEVGGKDKFWNFIDEEFKKSYDVAGLVTLAGQQGINTAKFQSCLNSGKYTQKINDQANKGQTAGIRGTPGTILLTQSGDGKLIAGAYPYESVKQLIDEALATK